MSRYYEQDMDTPEVFNIDGPVLKGAFKKFDQFPKQEFAIELTPADYEHLFAKGWAGALGAWEHTNRDTNEVETLYFIKCKINFFPPKETSIKPPVVDQVFPGATPGKYRNRMEHNADTISTLQDLDILNVSATLSPSKWTNDETGEVEYKAYVKRAMFVVRDDHDDEYFNSRFEMEDE